ncbi:MAG: hypothetical protein OXL97_04225 [Chloroflexota bacterium]|nr:hypothetical protein [Chloroflexota bacterium]MDE2883917.1 hypothetical protein [Chloroflexota bacterium]
MRKRWLVVPALAALLLTGVIAGTAFAQDGSSDDDSRVSRFVEILAGKLGIGEEELQTSVDETMEELQAERKAAWEQRLRDKLAAMVEEGKVTQEQADEYLDWYLDPPEIARGDSRGRFGFGKGHHRGMRGGFSGRGRMHRGGDSGETSSDAVAS